MLCFVKNVNELDVFNEGKKIRWSEDFAPGGTNVNFAELTHDGIFVRTFERGVEDETFHVVQVSQLLPLLQFLSGHFDTNTINVKTRGGNLSVEMKPGDGKVTGIMALWTSHFRF